mmetsp:Transcript_398/g.921  ORF Transcript_398/g.921 Transcript_398/m.921 type:complete len:370 (-) Transcript_398:89-1198(-)|eukprot:CAMPEP_0171516596 /NCGR_PEP_ID=MMETSP0959-20130129/4134_1 /TAXON_ID=87120 /ORGANISM="Aurantiochytrium limacinum, Strain ATCCMYA-1381" /LENGTH=369 /DNA_ID=CAMNT_0012055343 /DNA_START=73 /DNA_END=1182 /DNA_ORIENTATION=+
MNEAGLLTRVLRLLRAGEPDTSDAGPNNADQRPALRVGLLGASNISKFAMINPASRRSDVQVYGVATRTPGKAASFAQSHGIPHAYDSFEDLLVDESIDAVYISVVTEEHFRVGLQAIQAGKHVLLEKPLALTAKEARTLYEAADKHNVILMEAMHYKHHPVLQRVRDILDSGEIGEVENIHVRFAKFDTASRGYLGEPYTEEKLRTKMFDRWIYCIDLINFLAPNHKVSQVLEAHDEGFIIHGELELEVVSITEGRAPIIHATWETDCQSMQILPDWSATVECSFGSLQLQNFNFPSLYHRIYVEPLRENARYETHYGEDGKTTFEYQLDSFCQAIGQKAVDPLIAPEVTLASLDAADRVRDAFITTE